MIGRWLCRRGLHDWRNKLVRTDDYAGIMMLRYCRRMDCDS